MKGKNFTSDAADVFVSQYSQESVEIPQQEQEQKPQPKQTGKNQAKQERICILMDSAIMEKVRAIAYYDRRKIADIFRDAVADHVAKYEKRKGKIRIR